MQCQGCSANRKWKPKKGLQPFREAECMLSNSLDRARNPHPGEQLSPSACLTPSETSSGNTAKPI